MSCSTIDLPYESPVSASPKLGRLIMKADSPTDNSSTDENQTRKVVIALLETLQLGDEDVRQASAQSLALIAQSRPILVLSEWQSFFSNLKQKQIELTPSIPRKASSSNRQTYSNPQPLVLFVCGLKPVMERVVRQNCLNSGDVRHRAVLGQIIAILVEEMIVSVEVQSVAEDILVRLAASYMDKVMDVVLVHFQPNTATVHPIIVNILGSLAKNHPHTNVPFLKAILCTTSHLIKSNKVIDGVLRASYAKSLTHFCDAILDYLSNISEMSDNSLSLSQYQSEADVIYEHLFGLWMSQARDRDLKLAVLSSVASITPFLSTKLLMDKSTHFITTILGLYKRISASLGSSLEITNCLAQILELTVKTDPTLLEPLLDPIFNTMFHQVCIPTDYDKPHTVKNHNEVLRCYDTMMKHFSNKLVGGLLSKVDNSEERCKIGALTVVRHLLNMPTDALGEILDDIFGYISKSFKETNSSVQKVLAQIIVLLGHHGTIKGNSGRECVEFIVRHSSLPQRTDLTSGKVTQESLGEMCSNILLLLTTSVPSMLPVLWPYNLEYLFLPDTEAAVPAVARSLVHLAEKSQDQIDWSQFQFCTSGVKLLARLTVLCSVPNVGGRGIYILKFLLQFSPNINRHLDSAWQSRFPLLLHYLEQHKDKVDLEQWQEWLLSLINDSVVHIGSELFTGELVSALVEQLVMYDSDSWEKSFCIVLIGQVMTKSTKTQLVMDTLSSLFLVSLNRKVGESACARAFGLCGSVHFSLVISKLEMLYNNQVNRRNTLFFGLLRDKNSEESQARTLTTILECIGQTATRGNPEQLLQFSSKIVEVFLIPCLNDYKDSEKIRDAALAGVHHLTNALLKISVDDKEVQLLHHEELLHAAISFLQNPNINLCSRQLALNCLTGLVQLPPNISQLSRCSLLKACFSTIFTSFLEHQTSKAEDYGVASIIDQQLTSMVNKLHILIRELLQQDMEPSTLDEIFTMLEPWLKLDQDLSREISVNIFYSALDTYIKNIKLGVNSPSNFTPGPYMIGAIIPRCCDPSKKVRQFGLDCLQHLLRILALYEGLAQETIEASLVQLQEVNKQCNSESGRLDVRCTSQALVSLLGERIQHQHILSLLDSLVDSLLDTQVLSVKGTAEVLEGMVISRGSEVFQNIAGFVRKLHDKMGLMGMDETADLIENVGEVIHQFCVHNTRGVVTSLVHLPMPIDREAKLVWQCLAGDTRVGGEVIGVLLEVISQDQEQSISVSNHQVVGATNALTLMLETHKLEEVARIELGRLMSSLVMILSRSLGVKYTSRGSVISLGKVDADSLIIDPIAITIDALRALFSCLNCVVVASALQNICLADYNDLVHLLNKFVGSVAQHAPHLLPAIVSGHVPFAEVTVPDCMRVASLAVLQACAENKAGGDLSLLAKLQATLLACCSDPLSLTRRLALQGIPILSVCGEVDLESRCLATLSALIAGVEDEQCSAVSLTALRGLVTFLPHVPKHHLYPLASSLALKVRPFFESSSDDHRAAAISVYSSLATCADGDRKTSYLDYFQSILVPILLHSNSSHIPTKKACLTTLKSLALVIEFQPLIDTLATHDYDDDFSLLVSKIVRCRCGALIEMYHTAVANSLSYFKSKNPLLRSNVVFLLSEILGYTQDNEQEKVQEELVTAAVQGIIDLLSDSESNVRKSAAMCLGQVAVLSLC